VSVGCVRPPFRTLSTPEHQCRVVAVGVGAIEPDGAFQLAQRLSPVKIAALHQEP
jgi:hypothetical protein